VKGTETTTVKTVKIQAAEKRMRKKITTVLCAVLCAGMLATGCGKEEKISYIDEGMTAIGELRYEDALANFDQALVSGEDKRLIYRGQGLANLGLTKYDEAVAALEKCLASGSSVPDEMDYDVNYYLATAYYKAGRLEEAKQVYDAILALRNNAREAYFMRGIIELKMGNYELGKPDFDKAIELAPGDYDQIVEIYKVMDETGYREAGRAYLETAVKDAPKDMSNYDKGRIYFYLEDFEAARNYLEQARDAGNDKASYDLGKTWENLGEYNYAASVYISYLQDQGESALIYNQLALCNMQLEDYDAALSALQSGLALEDTSLRQTLSFNQIVAYEKKGDFKQAAQLMSQYVKDYPDDTTAVREYEFLRSR